MIRRPVFILLLLVVLTSCSHRKPTTTVELIDTSLSISPRAEQAAFAAVRKQIDRMGRGDRLILIPVTGDAENDAGGRVLRIEAPTARQAYDADLRKFRTVAAQEFSAWASARDADRSRTDLLGSLDVARQDLASVPKGSVMRLTVVSDFIEDDGELRFTSDPRLASAARARQLAARLRSAHGFSLGEMQVCLGRLASGDFASLAPARREAIDAFWRAYFAGGGRAPEIQIDGLGLIANSHSPCPAAPISQPTREVR